MIPFSILDLAPIGEGKTLVDALKDCQAMARQAEQCGYRRIWLAEHHGMRAVASSATAVMLAHIGSVTSHIRLGAGGIMLPNHSPLVIAEQFGTLAAMFPGRIDLGLGRAPGTDMDTMKLLQRNTNGGIEDYPKEIQELQQLLGEKHRDQTVIAVPGADSNVPLWLLGSSLYSAELAAKLGLPYSYASHFAPDQLIEALQLYRAGFKPSEQRHKPYVMAGVMAVVADSDEEAQYLFTSVQQQFINLRHGINQPFPMPVEDMTSYWTLSEQAILRHTLQYAVVGSAANVEQKLVRFIRHTQANELILSVPIHNIQARLHTLELVSQMDIMRKVKGD